MLKKNSFMEITMKIVLVLVALLISDVRAAQPDGHHSPLLCYYL
jgi:hypothetical protein